MANLIWFLLLGAVGWAMFSQGLGDNGVLTLVPTVAMAAGMDTALNGSFPGIELVVLVVWAAVASFAAVRWFRFEG